MWHPRLTACVFLFGGVSLALILPGDAWSQGNPFAEVRAQIAILNDKLEEIQESIENLALNGQGHPELRWDQQIPAAERFVRLPAFNDLRNGSPPHPEEGVVLDKETGLLWHDTAEFGVRDWVGARSVCANSTHGNRSGWRLPSLPELASILEPDNQRPALPAGHPFNFVEGVGDSELITQLLWTATTDAANPAEAWMVNFWTGLNEPTEKSAAAHWLCVRGPMNADQY